MPRFDGLKKWRLPRVPAKAPGAGARKMYFEPMATAAAKAIGASRSPL